MGKITTISHVRIGGLRVSVVEVLSEDWGGYRHDERTIEIGNLAAATLKDYRETLRHEMMHAALQIGGVGFSDRYDEESVVRCLETIFFPAWERVRRRLEK